MKRTVFALVAAVAATAISALPAQRAAADNETDQVTVEIQAPLDSSACGATPPTITVLGLAIDVSTAVFDTGDCTTLTAGQPIEVKLASDSTPLAATQVNQGGGNGGSDNGNGNNGSNDNGNDSNNSGGGSAADSGGGSNGGQDIKVQAPIQSTDATAKTVTLLGLTVDVSGASLDGADDSGQNTQPIDFTQLIVGQFVAVQLTSNTAPFVATGLELKNFTNQVQLEVANSAGQQVDDVDSSGNPVNDVSVDVTEVVPVQNTTTGAGGAAAAGPRIIKKVLHFHAASNGSVTLTGLPTGLAKIVIHRTTASGNSVGRRITAVKGNTTRTMRVRLWTVRSR
ncbi:MAG: hypothetical protein ACHQ9S_13960 [Candidatus Binatia bacterium]